VETADAPTKMACRDTINPVFMNKSNRDIYLLSPHGLSVPNERELDSMHAQLFEAERIHSFAKVHEYIDAARNQIHRNQVLIKRHIRSKQEISFVFLNCLN
jgi:hypothetical protein